jgi:hypothetical protein
MVKKRIDIRREYQNPSFLFFVRAPFSKMGGPLWEGYEWKVRKKPV